MRQELDARLDAWRACAGAQCFPVRPRTKLLYNHIPKCGGKYVREALQKVLPPTPSCCGRSSTPVTRMIGGTILSWRRSETRAATTSRSTSTAFRTGATSGARWSAGTRSSWAPTTTRRGASRRGCATRGATSRGDSSGRLPDVEVDCWVRTSHTDADLARCLRRFQNEGGVLSEAADAILGDVDGGGSFLDERPNAYAHGSTCSERFADPALRAAVFEADATLVDLFAGEACCGTLPQPPISDRRPAAPLRRTTSRPRRGRTGTAPIRPPRRL